MRASGCALRSTMSLLAPLFPPRRAKDIEGDRPSSPRREPAVRGYRQAYEAKSHRRLIASVQERRAGHLSAALQRESASPRYVLHVRGDGRVEVETRPLGNVRV